MVFRAVVLSFLSLAAPFVSAASAANAQQFVFFVTDDGRLQVRDAATGRYPTEIDLGLGSVAPGRGTLVLSADGARAYVVRRTDIAVIDLAANRIAATWRTGTSPASAALSADGTRLYVRDTGSVTVTAINTATGVTAKALTLAVVPADIALSADGAWLVAANGTDNSVTFVNTTTGALTRVGVASTASAVAIARDGRIAYVATGTNVVVIDRQTLAVLAYQHPSALATDVNVVDVSISPDDKTLLAAFYRASPLADATYAYDTIGQTWSVALARGPKGAGLLSWAADGSAWTTGQQDGGFRNLVRWTVSAMVGVGGTPATFETQLGFAATDTLAIAIGNKRSCTIDPAAMLTTRIAGGTQSIAATGNGCAWSAVSNDSWITLSSASGAGATAATITVAPNAIGRRGEVVVNGFDIEIRQIGVLGNLDTPAENAHVRQPFTLSGWGFEETGPTNVESTTRLLVAYPNPGSGAAPVVLPVFTQKANRPDLAAVFGPTFQFQGYSTVVQGLSPGLHLFVLVVKSDLDGTSTLYTRYVTIDPPIVDVAVAIDLPRDDDVLPQPFLMTGWALDRGAVPLAGTAVDTVQVWAWPVDGGTPFYLGTAKYGHPRGDVGVAFGSQFVPSGFALLANVIPAGTYRVVAYARSNVTFKFEGQAGTTVTLTSTQMAPGAIYVESSGPGVVTLAGYAWDPHAGQGNGIDVVHVWAYPASGQAPIFLGAPVTEGGRPELTLLVSISFWRSYWRIANAALPSGRYTIVAYGHSTITGQFDNIRVLAVDIR